MQVRVESSGITASTTGLVYGRERLLVSSSSRDRLGGGVGVADHAIRPLSYYAVAHQACQESRQLLSKLKLSYEENQLLVGIPVDAGHVNDRLKTIMEDKAKLLKRPAPRAMTRSSEFYTKFCDVVLGSSALVKILQPLGTDYLLPFGLLMILFKVSLPQIQLIGPFIDGVFLQAVVTRKDREESMMVHLEALIQKLPPPTFYQVAMPSNTAKAAVAALFAKVVKLLGDTLVYYRAGRLCKLLDVILGPVDAKLARHISQIEAEAKALESTPIAIDSQPINTATPVTETGKLVARLYENSEKAIVTVGVSMEHLNQRLASLELKITRQLRFPTRWGLPVLT